MDRNHGHIHERVSFPRLMSVIMDPAIHAFSLDHVQAYQYPAVHMFIATLIADALARHPEIMDDVSTMASGFESALIERSAMDIAMGDAMMKNKGAVAALRRRVSVDDAARAAWSLHQPDGTIPAFMQTAVLPSADAIPIIPCEGKDIRNYPVWGSNPKEISSLLFGPQHSIKAGFSNNAMTMDQWSELVVYGLIDAQTMSGYGGRGNPGIAKMNGGASTRVMSGIRPSGHISGWIRRDAEILYEALVNHRADAFSNPAFERSGVLCLWCIPWNGEKEEGITPGVTVKIHPLVIEVCRRIRVHVADDARVVLKSTSDQRFSKTYTEASCGITDDPWSHIEISGDKQKGKTWVRDSLSNKAMISAISGGEVYGKKGVSIRPSLLTSASSDIDGNRPMEWYIAFVERGMCKTAGFHQRSIPVPGTVAKRMGDSMYIQTINALAHRMLKEEERLRGQCIHALMKMRSGTDLSQPSLDKDPRVQKSMDQFSVMVDDIFFTTLWSYADAVTADPKVSVSGLMEAWTATVHAIAHHIVHAFATGYRTPYMRTAHAERIIRDALTPPAQKAS
jgi:CRISPR system Cascade subunit CasA